MFGNWMKTGILMAGIMGLLGVVGHAIGGPNGALAFLAIGAATNFFAYWFSDKMVLRMYNAQEVDEATGGRLHAAVKALASRAGLPMPRVYIIEEDQPNAFATGRNPEHAAVAATTGILRILNDRELQGVMAHELAHVKHRDILTSTISATIAGAVASLAQLGMFFGGRHDNDEGHPLANILLMVLAPIAAMLIQFAISRTREFEADRGGAKISGDPLSLASALDKIHRYAQGIPMPTAEMHPATAQMMIVNPLSGGGLRGLFSTHPEVGERIARLEALARQLG